MISKYTYSGLTWIDLESPSQEEILHILEESSLPEFLGDNISDLDAHLPPSWITLNLQFPSFTDNRESEEIRFLLGPNSIITIHQAPNRALKEFSSTFEAHATREEKLDIAHSGILFHHMITSLYQDLSHQLNHHHSLLQEGKTSMISSVKKILSLFKEKLNPHKETLDSFSPQALQFYGGAYNDHLSEIMNSYNTVQMTTDGYIEKAQSLYAVYVEMQVRRAQRLINTLIVIIALLVISNLIFIFT
jgi:Mg2+ and Co2+ transporter CorA